MKLRSILFAAVAAFTLAGCSDTEIHSAEEESDPTFMFWCFRKEIVSTDYAVPEMNTSAEAIFLQNRLKTIPGFVESSYNLSSHTLTVSYKSSTVRKMNFEEAIAQSGFAVNHRPAYPNTNKPAGVK
jgi:copper chaperone CopZ